jgi:ceramide glucosyltransferase
MRHDVARSAPARVVQLRRAMAPLLLSTGTLVFLLGSVLFVAVIWSHRALRRALEPPPAAPPAPRYPSLTVIRPIRGLDVGAAQNLAAALDTDYPGEVETLFVLDDENDPALPVVHNCVARHRAYGKRGRVEVIIAGPPGDDMTGKLHAMSVGFARARGELVAFGDSDTRPARDILRRLVDTLAAKPGAGCAFAPVVVREPARTPGDVAYALLINAWYGPAVARVARRASGHVPFIMGQLMVLRREALDAVGGVKCAAGQLVDDMYLGTRLDAVGYQNVTSRAKLDIVTGGMSVTEFVQLFRRWLLFSRNGLPPAFVTPHWVRGGAFWAALVLGVGALLGGSLLAAVLALLAVVALVASQIELQRQIGGPPIDWRHLWVAFAVPLSMPFAAFTVLFDTRVTWRGREYVLGEGAQLAAGDTLRPSG